MGIKVAFYAPLKAPGHPVPSGDRLMARLLIAALERAGATVEVVSAFRSFTRDPAGLDDLMSHASAEIERISACWGHDSAPDLWFTYHPYYKAPDLIGPAIATAFGLPYVTVEASYSRKRDASGWQAMQRFVADAVSQAAVNICMTQRDRSGLVEALPGAVTAMLAPFLEVSAFAAAEPAPEPGRLITVAMMRPGDKLDSFRALAASLALIADRDWTLSIIGDGPCRSEVEALFSGFDPDRIIQHGQQGQTQIARLLSRASLYVWPGCGEAYGLAYLEAQAAGLPVVAQAIAGVPEVVMDGVTGLLTPTGDAAAYAQAIATLLADSARRDAMAVAARDFAVHERSLDIASLRLAAILHEFTGLKI